jgi:hypothetical protein
MTPTRGCLCLCFYSLMKLASMYGHYEWKQRLAKKDFLILELNNGIKFYTANQYFLIIPLSQQ